MYEIHLQAALEWGSSWNLIQESIDTWEGSQKHNSYNI